MPPVDQNIGNNVGNIGRSLCPCGALVDPGIQNCDPYLWQPTGSRSMNCFANGGPNDPCGLNILNDVDNGLNKDPISCYYANNIDGRQNRIPNRNRRVLTFDTFFLWDEPDTYGRSYTWAGSTWAEYASRYANSIQFMRQNGIRFSSPLFSSGLPGILKQHVDEFYRACGRGCSDPNSASYIDIISVNAACRPSDTTDPLNPRIGCRTAAQYFVDEMNGLDQIGRVSFYITNWSRFNVNNAFDQLAALDVTDQFFRTGSFINRVYWFGGIDNGIGSQYNYLTSQIMSGARAGQTLGQAWAAECNC